MKKKVFLLLALLLSVKLFSADLRFINYSEIKKIENYENELLFAVNNEHLLRSWVSDDFWKADISKAECRANLNKLYKLICDNSEPKNIDYLLLKGIISEYLYNLDEEGFFEFAEKNYLSVEKLKNADYRYKWFLGVFYANAAMTLKGMETLQEVAAKVPEEYLVTEFFYNYAYIANMCKMPATSLSYLEKYSKYENVDVKDDWLYKSIQKSLIPFDTKKIDQSIVRTTFNKGNSGFFCRPFGFFISPKEDWNVRHLNPPAPTDYVVAFKSNSLSTKKGNVSYSVLFSAGMNENSFSKNTFSGFQKETALKEVVLIKDRPELKAYEFTDSSKYSEIGGSHGLIVYFTKEYSEDADIKMEFPIDYSHLNSNNSNGDGNAKYYLLQPEMKRANAPVTYCILLDSCGLIYEQSKKEFIEFLTLCEFN